MGKVRIAQKGIPVTTQLKEMEVGETLRFPLVDFNYCYVRTAPFSSALANERVLNNKEWTSKLNKEEKSGDITRIS